jgi:hypothetical protein
LLQGQGILVPVGWPLCGCWVHQSASPWRQRRPHLFHNSTKLLIALPPAQQQQHYMTALQLDPLLPHPIAAAAQLRTWENHQQPLAAAAAAV